ncbi:PilN domain-containing protein [uncultured Ferrimonas sp.]|uniref:PilN domain-containing protein n=1 Tax=uncultured Ferrimonas sp. TaxID=432640 RepID=UPI00260EC2B6|nr:PilN domain-containing protein [uncultured Ferrimonas sp.]
MKTRINLYSDTMLPPKPRLTLPLLVGGSVAIVLLLLLVTLLQQWQLGKLTSERDQALQQQQQLTDQVSNLSVELAKLKPSPQLQAQVAQAQATLTGLEQIGELLAQDKFLIEPGFSNLMRDLSVAADQQVWLQQFDVASGQLRLSGAAKTAAAVPAWIDKLGSQESLQGRALSQLRIDGEAGGPVTFEASHGATAADAQEAP